MTEDNRMDVLCLDDNPRHLDIICDVVEEKQHRVWGVQSVPEALKILEEKSIDCIVTDFELPDDNCDGIDFYLETRKRGYKHSVIFITSKQEIMNRTVSLEGDVRVVFKQSERYGRELSANLHNCHCKRVKEETGTYWL